MATTPANTANTLSVAFRPGEDLRFPNTSSEAIFTFGDYRIERNEEPDNITGNTRNLSFTPFSTLENMGVDSFNPPTYTSVQNNELKPIGSDPYSYSYFGSFYTEVARSINAVIDEFPYAALAYDNGNSATVFDYQQVFNSITQETTSNFKISASVITNQGGILFNSGSTANNQFSLMTQTDLFEVQLSGASSTNVHKIISYSYTGGTSPTLEFTIKGSLITGTTATSTVPIYIRPSRERFTEYKIQMSRLENQLLFESRFDIPDVDNADRDFSYVVPWPKAIDGFNPDISGDTFETYKDNILLLAGNVDLDKTDIMLKTMIPENFLDFDTDTQIYKKLVSSYARQFDEVKNFIDNIAYGHTITYDGENNIPDKFLVKLSNLLGWKLSNSFSDIDLFEYLADDDDNDQNSFAYYNVEIWKRILVNINWLYKKKGTRDALQFIFKLIGAPECLISFNEFVYDINSTITNSTLTNSVSKTNARGFIDYDTSQFIFQEGGPGRGDGQRYIEQWRPEFSPLKRVDNEKVQVGLTAFTGSENIVNTKETEVRLDPANAVECDVFEWYQLSGTCWVWGSNTAPVFSSNTTPFEYAIPNCDFVNPSEISGMTLSDYLTFIYQSNIEPRNRKTNNQMHTSWGYPELKRIYLNYFYLSEPRSNQLTIKKLEAYLDLLEVNFEDYLLQLIPATTILEHGTVYRNTVFHRQRFVYKEGINDGSEFQNELPPDLRPPLTPIKISTGVNDFLTNSVPQTVINSGVSQGITSKLEIIKIQSSINQNSLGAGFDAFDINGVVQPPVVIVTPT